MKDADGISLFFNGYDSGYENALKDIKELLDDPECSMENIKEFVERKVAEYDRTSSD